MTGRFPICQGEIPKEGNLPSLIISASETLTVSRFDVKTTVMAT